MVFITDITCKFVKIRPLAPAGLTWIANLYAVKYSRSNCLSREALVHSSQEKTRDDHVLRLPIVDTRLRFHNIYPEVDIS